MVEFTRAGARYSTLKLPFCPKDYMELPRGVAAQIVPEKGQSSISSITFVLADIVTTRSSPSTSEPEVSPYFSYRYWASRYFTSRYWTGSTEPVASEPDPAQPGGEITALVGLGPGGDTVTLYQGFKGLDEADFVPVFTGIVDNFRLSDGLVGYEFTARSPDTLANRQWPELGTTALVGDISDVATSATVLDTTLFLDAGYCIIDEEVIQYAGKTDTTLTGLTRGALGSIATTHDDNATVQEMLRVGPAHPFDIRLSILQNTDKTGLAIDPALIDLVNAADVKADLDSSNPNPGEPYLMEFRLTSSVNAKQFIEDEILAPMACYPITTGGGLMAIRQFRQPSASGAERINHDSILGDDSRPLHLSWDFNQSSVINDVTVPFDYDVITGEFKSIYNAKSEPSISKYGKRPTILPSLGLRSEYPGTLSLIALRAAAILNRYKDSAPLVEVTTILQRGLIEPGDIVRFSSAIVPNRFTLTRGVTDSLYEVIGRSIDFAAGQVSFTLLQTSFGLARVWAPDDATEDWANASQAEREQYIYWAADDGFNGGSVPGGRWGF
jgi:hypothetical protein